MTFPTPDDENLKAETPYVLAYFAIYLAYLFLRPEGELLHWLTLVAIPLIWLLHRRRRNPAPLSAALHSVGLSRANWTRGIGWALLIGLALSVAQLWASRNRAEILLTLQSARSIYLLPLTFMLMLIFAGFTEEFFFRGLLQRRLQSHMPSAAAVVVASLMFGLYHLPYAYLHPRWPSHGDWPEALAASFGQGLPIGILLGTLYVRSRNLLACALCHALINLLPGMLQIKWRS